jgi:hypothetical protein
MLNELIELERGMAAYGFAAVPRHPDLSQLAKGNVVRVRLASNGAIAELERLHRATPQEIWTLRDGKHNGFPGLRTARGLIVLDKAAREVHEKRWKAAKSPAAQRSEIERLAKSSILDTGDWPRPAHLTRIAERLSDLKVLEADEHTRAVPAVFERFLAASSLQPPFLHRLFDRLIDLVRNGEDGWLEMARAALVDSVLLAIDVTGDFARYAGDPGQIEAISHALSAGTNHRFDNKRLCALSGATARLLQGNFPQPTLPGLGQTYLFSRNTDIRALARYGQNGPTSFPVGADLVSRFSGALAAVTEEGRRGKTWRLLPAESGGGRDLFITFVASAVDEPIVDSLAAESADDEDGGESTNRDLTDEVEAASSRLVEFWKGVAQKALPDERARILILRTVDPGNRKAVYDRSPSIKVLHRSARAWAAAMNNAPPGISFVLFKDKKTVDSRPSAQAPLSLISLSKALYVRGGRQLVQVPGLSAAEGMALFLDEGNRPHRARRVLRLLLDRQSALLSGLTHAKQRRQLKDFDPTTAGRKNALHSIAWMGALLHFLDRSKDTYMDDAGFKLGQLLSAMDAVHLAYCEVVRSGSVPSTLIGNSVFTAAGRNPYRSLDVLQPRWKPYEAWITKASRTYRATSDGGEESKGSPAIRRATSQARLARRLGEDLRPALARMREEGRPPDETFRAELLLGYLAGIRSEKKSDENQMQDRDTDT